MLNIIIMCAGHAVVSLRLTAIEKVKSVCAHAGSAVTLHIYSYMYKQFESNQFSAVTYSPPKFFLKTI